MTKWWLLAGAIACEVTGSLSLKGALDNPVLYIPVVVGFLASFACFTALLRRGMPLGVALTAVLSAVIYDEPFTLVMTVGVVLIMGGVLFVEVGSHAAQAARIDDPDGAV